jgi:hypothetical protein
MRRIIVAALLLPLAAACHAGGDTDGPGISGTGSGNQRSFAVRDFTGIELAGADTVDVRVGADYSVRAEGSEAALGRLRIDKKGDTLEIGRQRNTVSNGSDKITLHVTLPQLTEASVAGSGVLAVDRVEGAAFKASLGGSGTLTVAALRVDRAAFDLAGSGALRATGTTTQLDLDMAGSGSVDAPGLTSAAASVSMAGSGRVRTAVNGKADVSVMGSGTIDLGAGARCTVSKMGSGTVRCGG